MLRQAILGLLGSALITGSAFAQTTLGSGIALENRDLSVRPQDQFYLYTNGTWLKNTEVPGDKGRYDSWDQLNDDALVHLHQIVDELPEKGLPKDSEAAKIREIYSSFLDETTIEATGIRPLKPYFKRIESLKSGHDLPRFIAEWGRLGLTTPIWPQVHQDEKTAGVYVFDMNQAGTGLPGKEYYLDTSPQMQEIRAKYSQLIVSMLEQSGDPQAPAHAASIIALETEMARADWTRVEQRDPVKAYNKYPFSRLPEVAPGFDWPGYLKTVGVAGKVDYLLISEPSYITALNGLLTSTPISTWQAYFRFHLLCDVAPLMGKTWADERFAFFSTTLGGVTQMRPRWKLGLSFVQYVMGEPLGHLYAQRFFSAEAKARAEDLVHNILAAYRIEIDSLDWMSPATKERAKEKLSLLTTKIGYPSKWLDYRRLKIGSGVIDNFFAASVFKYDQDFAKFGGPVDAAEWAMTPQTVNAHYNPERNDILFPAAVLQPPLFNVAADDAANYGAIGGIIGHEISHAFDDQGNQYDGHGMLLEAPGWFTAEDLQNFKTKAQALVAQYAAFEELPGHPINGQLTLGENIGDNSGLSVAYQAYKLSLQGKDAPVIDGLTGDQRFFLGWTQIWRSKSREKTAILLLKSDVHAPDDYRGLLPERNMEAFYAAFGVKPGDGMYLPPEKRVNIW